MGNGADSSLDFLKGQEVCQVAFGMYDLQLNWGNGGLSITGRLLYDQSEGEKVTWTEGHPFDAAPLLRLLNQKIERVETPSSSVLVLQFSNGDRLTITPENGFEAFTIHQSGEPIIVGI